MSNDCLGYVAQSKYLGEKWLEGTNNEVGVEGGGRGWRKKTSRSWKIFWVNPKY